MSVHRQHTSSVTTNNNMGKTIENNHQKTSGENGSKKVIVFVKHDQSLLSELYYNDGNMRVLLRMIVFTNLLYFVTDVLSDSLKAKRLYWRNLDGVQVPTLRSIFVAFAVDGSLHLGAFLIYAMFKLWARLRSSLSFIVTAVDVLFIGMYLSVVILSFVYITVGLWHPLLDTNHFTRIVLSTEQIRLCMKSYAFIRENAYKVLYPWNKDDTTGPAMWYKGQMSPKVGSFNQYCYFLFAPTLLYRDHYPRSNEKFSWSRFLLHISMFVFSVTIMVLFFGMAFVDNFHWSNVVISLVSGLPLGILYGVVFNLCFMHSWMNLCADIVGFGDRRFYDSWWLCSNFEEFYRKWNIVPYHFNYEYLYRDIRKMTSSKYLSLFLMLLSSSAAHEYILGITFGYTVPLMTLLFAVIGSVIYILRFNGSFSMVVSISIGLYLLVWNAALEIQARKTCPREETYVDLFYPRLFECIAKHSEW